MTSQAKDLIKAVHNLLGKTNTGDFDNIAQADAVIKAMQLLSSVSQPFLTIPVMISRKKIKGYIWFFI